MSALGIDSQMTFGDRQALFIWFADHAASHQHYAARLVALYGQQPPLFDLIDVTAMTDWARAMEQPQNVQITEPMRAWLLAHTRLHQAESVPLNLATPPDLTTVDFRDPQQFYDWMDNHQALHDAQDLVLT